MDSGTSSNLLNLVKKRLSTFGIDDLNSQILSIVTDGCNPMIKLGSLISPVHQELCYSHCVQLAIIDVCNQR